MRLRVLAEPGALARHPEDALDALADVAAADGAAREDWLEKALRGARATRRELPVDHDYRFPLQRELAEEAAVGHRRMMARMRQLIVDGMAARAAAVSRRMAEEVRRAVEAVDADAE